MKLIYENVEYPYKTRIEEGYEEQIVLIPEASGDYFLAKIDSSGDYKLLESVAEADVEIVQETG